MVDATLTPLYVHASHLFVFLSALNNLVCAGSQIAQMARDGTDDVPALDGLLKFVANAEVQATLLILAACMQLLLVAVHVCTVLCARRASLALDATRGAAAPRKEAPSPR